MILNPDKDNSRLRKPGRPNIPGVPPPPIQGKPFDNIKAYDPLQWKVGSKDYNQGLYDNPALRSREYIRTSTIADRPETQRLRSSWRSGFINPSRYDGPSQFAQNESTRLDNQHNQSQRNLGLRSRGSYQRGLDQAALTGGVTDAQRSQGADLAQRNLGLARQGASRDYQTRLNELDVFDRKYQRGQKEFGRSLQDQALDFENALAENEVARADANYNNALFRDNQYRWDLARKDRERRIKSDSEFALINQLASKGLITR